MRRRGYIGRMNNGTQGIYRTYEEWDNGNGKLKPHIPLSHCLIVSSIRPIRLIRLIVPYNSPIPARRFAAPLLCSAQDDGFVLHLPLVRL